jgi:hypothetical protein
MRAIWIAATLASAGPQVEWEAPSACPDAEAASSTIRDGLDPRSELRIAASVREVEDGFAADVEIRSPVGETRRALHSPQCETLLDAVVLIAQAAQSEAEASAADTVEPEAQVEAPLVPEPEQDTQTVASPPPAVAEPRGLRKPARRPPLAVSPYLRLGGEIGWGITPVVDGGGGGAVGLQWRRLRVEAFTSVRAPTEETAAPGARARIWAWSVGARGCGIAWASRQERLAVPACGGMEGGEIVGKGEGPDLASSDTHRGAWVAIHIGPAFLVRVTRWLSFYAELDGLAVLSRPGFEIRRAGLVHRPSPVGVRAFAGLELHFPRRIRQREGIGRVWGAP